MGKVRIKQTGSIAKLMDRKRHSLAARRRALASRLAEDWVHVVQSTAWETTPASRQSIIAKITDNGQRVEMGWIPWGSRAGSERRLEMRKKIMNDIIKRRLQQFDLEGL